MGCFALLKSVSAGRPRQVRLLLDSGVSVNDADDLGQTALIRAIFIEHFKNREKIIRMLLRNGAVVSKADVVGRNSLAWSCLYGRGTEVALLLEHADVDLDLNSSDINGQTALYHSVSSGNAAVVKLMVEAMMKYRLNVDVPDFSGVTPLMQARRLGHDICGSILIHQGNATVGISARYPDDFVNAERWASRAHRNNRAQRIHKVNEFPPILSQALKNRIKFRENKAVRSRGMPTSGTSGSSDEESEEHTDELSEDCFLDTQIHNCLGIYPTESIPASILAISTASSPDSHADWESDEDEAELYSQNILHRQSMFVSTQELNKLYTIYQDQNTPSYRKGIPYRQTDMYLRESSSVSQSAVESKGKLSRSMSWMNVKGKLFFKRSFSTAREKLDTTEEEDNTDSLNSDQSKSSLSVLPAINEKTVSLVQGLLKGLKSKKQEKNCDYSAI